MFEALLDTRTKRAEESLPELAHEVRKLVKLSYPDATQSMVETLAKKQFLLALPDPELRLQLLKDGVKTLDEAVRMAVQIEAYKDAEMYRKGGSKRSVKFVNKVEVVHDEKPLEECDVASLSISDKMDKLTGAVSQLVENLKINQNKQNQNQNGGWRGSAYRTETRMWRSPEGGFKQGGDLS